MYLALSFQKFFCCVRPDERKAVEARGGQVIFRGTYRVRLSPDILDTHTHTHTHTQTLTHTHTHTHAYTCMHTHTHTRVCIYNKICLYTHTYCDVYIAGGWAWRARTHARTHVYTHTHTHTHTHVYYKLCRMMSVSSVSCEVDE